MSLPLNVFSFLLPGNFSFFWIRKDFSLWRMLKMLFRLNFLVVFICAVVANEYMLYYICAMHTYWFLSVYAFMGILSSWNTNRYKMAAKFVVYALFNAIIFDIPGISEIIFQPFWFILGFHDARFTIIHEWVFRVGLDHWSCFVGMLCAYNYPYFEALIKNLESNNHNENSTKFNLGVKILIAIAAVIALIAWHEGFMHKEKLEYNQIHPYTSFIPIVSFIVIRNVFKCFRSYYIHMFAWLGKLTLETYLSQLHIYLQANAKHIIVYIPDYPLLTFALSTIIYLGLSYLLFNLTTEFSTFFLPKDYIQILQKCMGAVLVLIGAASLAYVIHAFM